MGATTDDHVRKTIINLIEQYDDEVLTPREVVEHMTGNGYDDAQVRTVLESMVALSQVSYYRNGRLGRAV